MLILHKVFTLWLMMAVVKWSNGFFYNRTTSLSALDNDTMFDATNEAVASSNDNATEKFIGKRSTDALEASGFTTSNQIDDSNQYTYLNIGVLMASHLGKYSVAL